MLERFTWYRQSAFQWRDDERTIYIDPWGTPPDALLADIIFITHAHFDHFRPDEIERLSTAATVVVAPHDVAPELPGTVVRVAPDETHEIAGVPVETVPAYNTRPEAQGFHPRANRWVGYILELEGRRYYHAGDTDAAPELADVRADVAMLPVGGHFTMDVEEAAELARSIEPRLAVPMHFGFAIGSSSDGDRFAVQAAPVPVVVLTPRDPFERR
jgi:L-ascorbate metabolism protein UlaG (beta-lactamase superfamily)